MAKYGWKFKLMLVREYKQGKLGYNPLAEKYGMKCSAQLKKWVKVYEKFGAEGLMRKKHKGTYSVQFKLDVLSFMMRTGSSKTETALHLGLTNPTLIASWKKAFRGAGVEGLNKIKGRPPMSDKAKNKKRMEPKELSYEQKLERENELLRLEVEYLKKLRAFQMDPEAFSKSTSSVIIELKETFKLKDVLQIVGIPESSYHYHIKNMKKENPDQELEELIQSIFEEHNGNYGYKNGCICLKIITSVFSLSIIKKGIFCLVLLKL